MSDLSPKTILNYDYDSYKGFFAENFVAEELLNTREKQLFSWQEHASEIEFLIECEGKAIPIEVKSGSNVKSKSLKVFGDKYQPEIKIILSGKPMRMDSPNKERYYPLYLAGWLSKLLTV